MKKKSNKEKGLKYENIVAKMLTKYTDYTVEGKTIGSGCFWHSKGDLLVSKNGESYLIEIKGTEKDAYRISSKLVTKIWNEALDEHKLPLFVVLHIEKNYRLLTLMQIGRVNKISGKYGKTCVLNKKELLEYFETNLNPYMTLEDDNIQWLLTCDIIKEVT